jgi:hypothetical protein
MLALGIILYRASNEISNEISGEHQLAGISRTKAALRISGDDLDPDEVSKLLGAAPTESARKGDARQLALLH